MDIRKEFISTQKLCRFCLNHNDSLSSLYDRIKAPKDAVPLSLKILSCVGFEVFPSDKMPQYICQYCKFFMDLSYRFKQICRQGDENILQFIQKGQPISPVLWPAALKKMFKAMAPMKSNELGVVETVTQSGDTVQVMAEEMSDSEEGEDDNIYNVKVPDGPEEGKRIKVVTTEKDSGKKRTRKDSEEESAGRASTRAEAGCWPCDECDCTYPLEQLLSLHKAQKHRTRNIACIECDAKFFTKYDLITHQLTHSTDMPFQCVACGKKFKRLILLKRHERLIHSELPQQVCPSCPATFLSIEELEAHKKRHVHLNKPHACNACDKRFHDKNLLHKHIEGVHNKKSIFICQYCNERFSTVTKLTRHVRAHAGERPYPCKHCDKSFIKSHHYTRHLRVKHSDRQGGALDSDPYRCEECEESFATQDDLMYHSALHATRNLVCPLCQEKFDDVDTVTAHIKSHVNGNQFMCDFCELIFTSKEKLENHIARAHEDELLAEQDMDQDETSMEMDEEEDDDNSINLKEEGDHMVVEIKKADGFMLPAQEEDYKMDNTQSEDSEVDASYDDSKQDLVQNTLTKAMPAKEVTKVDTTTPQVNETEQVNQQKPAAVSTAPAKTTDAGDKQTASILKKAEEIKRKVFEQQSSGTSIEKSVEKKLNNNNKVESSSSTTGPSEKSLRLLEKELQDLKRTSRNEAAKTPLSKTPLESLRKRQIITSTPKTSRNADKKEIQNSKPTPDRTTPSEKKAIERRSTQKDPKDAVKDKDTPTKDSKESKDATNKDVKDSATKDPSQKESVIKDSKETKEAVVKEPKEAKNNVSKEDNIKEEVPKADKKESKDKENAKTVVKNGVNDKPPEEAVRRSTRPSKVKDYAKMIRDDESTSAEETDADNIEDKQESEKPGEVSSRGRGRKSITKPSPTAAKAAPTPPAVPKKRGRPRKTPTPNTPAKVRKTESSEQTDKSDTVDENETPKVETPVPKDEPTPVPSAEENTEDTSKAAQSNLIVSPTGQTLKKVPIKALPPGVRPLPLPRTMGAGEVCEMQIGKKVVKVQKIVMTKAEVEAMAKKGLVEMKDGTMVLKQGIKLPDSASLKSTLVGEGDKAQESPKKE